jgi:hypothetical protein
MGIKYPVRMGFGVGFGVVQAEALAPAMLTWYIDRGTLTDLEGGEGSMEVVMPHSSMRGAALEALTPKYRQQETGRHRWDQRQSFPPNLRYAIPVSLGIILSSSLPSHDKFSLGKEANVEPTVRK